MTSNESIEIVSPINSESSDFSIQNEKTTSPNANRLRVLELYSGIGGMRYALKASGIDFEIVAASDINPVVNSIYMHNFGTKDQLHRNILSYTAPEIDKLEINMITMSPPCQPFTRVGLRKDVDDARTSSFLHILQVLPMLQKRPQYILLENVKGFEESLSRSILVNTIRKCGYAFQEFLLSPRDFGIPNSRLRYYLIANIDESDFSFSLDQKILYEIPDQRETWNYSCSTCHEDGRNRSFSKCNIQHFLEEKPIEYFEPYLVPEDTLLKHFSVLDIVDENSEISCCFTKAYGRYAQGTGSVLNPFLTSNISEVLQTVTQCADIHEKIKLLKRLKLRYFTPREIANLMCFPHTFEFPSSVQLKQMYKSLGNSINVFVVASLLKLLLKNH